MASINVVKNKAGDVTGYRFRACVGRDEHYRQIWRTMTIRRPEGLTPAKERKEVQRLADEWERKEKAAYENSGDRIDKSKITLAAFIEKVWLPLHVHDGSHTPRTIVFYEGMAQNIVEYFGPKKRIAAIDAESVKKFVRWLQTEAKMVNGDPYSPTTVMHTFSTLRNFLRFAKRFGYIVSDPTADLLPSEKPHREKKKVDFLEPKDARRFIRCLEDEPLQWQCEAHILITCGLRRGEMVGLQWQDLDLERMTLLIRRNVTVDSKSEHKYHIGATKTGEERTVPISRRLCDMLLKLKKEQRELFGADVLPTGFIFSSVQSPYIPLYPSTPTRQMQKFVKRHNLPNVSPHDLRHTAATLALEQGASLKEVQELLGHRDPSTTLAFYTGITEAAARRTNDNIEKVLGLA